MEHPSLSVHSKRCCDFPLKFEREIEAVQAVHLNDCVYVGEGYDSCKLFAYSPRADNWNVLDTPRPGVFKFALASYKSKLVLIGGRQYIWNQDGKSATIIDISKILVLDFATLKLQDQVIPSMQSNRVSACAVSSGDHLIVAGGDKANTVEVYNSDSNEWSYVTPLPQVRDVCIVKSGTLHSDGNLYLHLHNSNKNYVFFAPVSALVHQALRRVKENSSHTWSNLHPHDDGSQFLPRYVCSNLTTHLGHLMLIGTDHDYSYSFFVYNISNAKRWVAVGDLPLEERLVKPLMQPQDSRRNHIVSISSKELLILGELVNSYRRCINLCVSFQTGAVDLKSPFKFRDLEKLKFPVLQVFENRYDLGDILELDESAVPRTPYEVYSEKDPAGIRSIKEWIKLDQIKHPGTKEVTWENLLWLLEECKADVDDPEAHCEMIKNLRAYITSTPGDDAEPEEMDTDHNTLQMVSSITSTVKELCARAAVKDAVSDSDRKMLITCAEEAEKKLTEEINVIEREKEKIEADIKTELIKNNIS